jgi:branched-subunit amino acid aminotransferase/4-amino-4-deoxychorismate lyase
MAKAHFTMADGGPVLPLAGPDRGCKHLGREQWTAARRVARAAGWDEVLLGDLTGRLVEAGGSNVFFVVDGVLHTPSVAVGPLPGIMRAKVLALAGAQGWPVREGEFSVRDLAAASEIWLTNSLIGVRPVAVFAGRQLDSAHPVLHRLRAAWREAHGWDPMVIVNHGQ